MDNLLAGAVAWVWEAKVDGGEAQGVKLRGRDLVATLHQVAAKPRHLPVALLGESVDSVLLEPLAAMRIRRTRLKSEPQRS